MTMHAKSDSDYRDLVTLSVGFKVYRRIASMHIVADYARHAIALYKSEYESYQFSSVGV